MANSTGRTYSVDVERIIEFFCDGKFGHSCVGETEWCRKMTTFVPEGW
jgi:hypothetical protein